MPAISTVPTRLRILIVEDDFLIGMLLGDMLEVMGHEVCAIEQTEQGAVSAATRLRPQLLIVDGQLREGDGIAAVERIVGGGTVPHIFVTGDSFAVLRRRPDAEVVTKPFTESMLAQAIGRVCSVT